MLIPLYALLFLGVSDRAFSGFFHQLSYKEAFQTLWKTINHKYAYTVDFDSDELIHKAIDAIDANLYVSQLQYMDLSASAQCWRQRCR